MDFLIESIVIGVDSIIVSILYLVYKHKKKTLNNINKAVEIKLDESVLDKSTNYDYVMINGVVEPIGIDLESNYKRGYNGVIRLYEVKEKKLRPSNNTTHVLWETLSKEVDVQPFVLRNKSKNVKVEITQPTNAQFLMDELETTHRNFVAVNDSVATRVFSVLFTGEVTKGYETCEKMLKNGTILYAYGKLDKTFDDKFRLLKPSTDTNYDYIITKKTRIELIEDLKSTNNVLKMLMIVFGSIGIGFGIYCFYKFYKKTKEQRAHHLRSQQLRQERLKSQRQRLQNYDDTTQNTINNSNNNNNESNDQSKICLICLTNPREVILLDCGHICMCIDCLDRLTSKLCPVCRQQYSSFARCYLP